MKSIVALLVLAFAAIAFTQFPPAPPACPVTTCVKAGSVCNTSPFTLISCRGDSYCNKTSPFSNVTTGICLVPKKVGESCYSNIEGTTECVDGTDCKQASDGNSTCALESPIYNYLYPGESCKGDLQCIDNNPDPGTDGSKDLCKSGNCKSVKNGDYCVQQLSGQAYDQCHYGKSYCSNANRCEKNIKKGGACSTVDQTQYGCGKSDERSCMPNALTGTDGTCQDFVSRKVGEVCRDINDCQEGLFCSRNFTSSRGFCVQPNNASPTVRRPCNDSSSVCNSDNAEQCVCVKGSGTAQPTQLCLVRVYPKGYYKAQRDYNRCKRLNGCNGVFGCEKSGACKSQYCKFSDFAAKDDAYNVDCEYEGVCNSAFALFASPFLALLAFLAVFAL